jgi:hypothetical protein
MSHPSLTHDELFGDLDLEAGAAASGPDTGHTLGGTFADDLEAVVDELGFTPASALLSESEPAIRPTQPYDILSDEFARSATLWGDDERFSSLCTTPLSLEELPAEAYPTLLNLFEDAQGQ